MSSNTRSEGRLACPAEMPKRSQHSGHRTAHSGGGCAAGGAPEDVVVGDRALVQAVLPLRQRVARRRQQRGHLLRTCPGAARLISRPDLPHALDATRPARTRAAIRPRCLTCQSCTACTPCLHRRTRTQGGAPLPVRATESSAARAPVQFSSFLASIWCAASRSFTRFCADRGACAALGTLSVSGVLCRRLGRLVLANFSHRSTERSGGAAPRRRRSGRPAAPAAPAQLPRLCRPGCARCGLAPPLRQPSPATPSLQIIGRPAHGRPTYGCKARPDEGWSPAAVPLHILLWADPSRTTFPLWPGVHRSAARCAPSLACAGSAACCL